MVEGVECDVICIGRFYDFLEKRKGKWGLVWRRLTYEKDRSTRSIPRRRPSSTRSCSARFPIGYRHLAYLQTKVGYKVKGHAGREGRRPTSSTRWARMAEEGSKKIGGEARLSVNPAGARARS